MAFFSKIKQSITHFLTRTRESFTDMREGSAWLPVALIFLAVYLVVGTLFGIYWSIEPDGFDVREAALEEVAGDEAKLVTGVYTTAALIRTVETMLHKPGGYLTNDMLYPGVWLDNVPNWEYGALMQVRDLSKAMREAFSRSQSQSREDEHLAKADPQFNFSNDSWMLPTTESEYRQGVKHLRAYLNGLSDESSTGTQFYARADNLRYWLVAVEMRLGNLAQSLGASVGPRKLNTDLAGELGARQATRTAGEVQIRTTWTQIDDNFYQARGSTWALIQFLKAIEIDFAGVLETKNARVSLQQIIRDLEATQNTVWSPVILNGGGFGVLANHSLVMASYISSANAAVIDLRELLSRG